LGGSATALIHYHQHLVDHDKHKKAIMSEDEQRTFVVNHSNLFSSSTLTSSHSNRVHVCLIPLGTRSITPSHSFVARILPARLRRVVEKRWLISGEGAEERRRD
jgi:hypothetical protein